MTFIFMNVACKVLHNRPISPTSSQFYISTLPNSTSGLNNNLPLKPRSKNIFNGSDLYICFFAYASWINRRKYDSQLKYSQEISSSVHSFCLNVHIWTEFFLQQLKIHNLAFFNIDSNFSFPFSHIFFPIFLNLCVLFYFILTFPDFGISANS